MARYVALRQRDCISTKGESSGAKYRAWAIVNIVLWCIYDILSVSYSALVTHIPQLTFAVVGVLIHDRKKVKSAV